MSGTIRLSEASPAALTSRSEGCGSIRNGVLCALVLAASVLVANPAANMPFIDAFSYTKTALDFARTGHFVYNGWATAMLGWMVPWGALFIKIFGFSFTIVRLSMLPIAMVTVCLFHQILRRFGINRQNAILGTLTMALSPLFLPLASSYMTDVPGLLVILICVYMCQRAIAAGTDRAALLWLCSAALVNVGGGTVRQIAWLGALVMVPSTAWLLRERRGMKVAGVLTWLAGIAGIVACLHWFNKQPYSVPQHLIAGPIHIWMPLHLAAQLLKTFFCLLLVIFPASVMWLPTVRRLDRKSRVRFAGAMAAFTLLAIVLYLRGFDHWLMPWLVPVLEAQVIGLRLWIRLVISLLVIAPVLILATQLRSQKWKKLGNLSRQPSAWSEMAWVLGPFTLGYFILLAPLGTFAFLQDRYALGLVPVALIVLLKLYQEQVSARLSTVGVATLIVFAVYSIAGTHDFFAQSRAIVSTVQMVQRSGISRRLIQAGMESDGWAQIESGGHINDSRIQVPAGAYVPDTPKLEIPPECAFWFAGFTPAIVPRYFIVSAPRPCFSRTNYPPVYFRAWLPPYHRALYVQQIRNTSN